MSDERAREIASQGSGTPYSIAVYSACDTLLATLAKHGGAA